MKCALRLIHQHGLQLVRRPIQVKRVGGAHSDVNLAAQVRTNLLPLLSYKVRDIVVIFPVSGDRRINISGFTVKHLQGSAIYRRGENTHSNEASCPPYGRIVCSSLANCSIVASTLPLSRTRGYG